MDNLGQFLKDGIKKVSEAAVDVVVTSIVENQEHHLHNLQDMQKWGIVKLIKRWTTGKYLHQCPNVVEFDEWSLLDLFRFSSNHRSKKHMIEKSHCKNNLANTNRSIEQKKSQFTSMSFLKSPIIPPSVGKIKIRVSTCLLTLCHYTHLVNRNNIGNYQWKMVVSLECDKKETQSCKALTRLDTAVDFKMFFVNGILDKVDSDNFYVLPWNTELIFDSVKDLWSDICLDVMCRKLKSSKKTWDKTEAVLNSSKKNDSFQPLDTLMSNYGSSKRKSDELFLKDKAHAMVKNDGKGLADTFDTKQDLLAAQDSQEIAGHLHYSRWISYGRVLLPLVSLLSSAETSFSNHMLGENCFIHDKVENRSSSCCGVGEREAKEIQTNTISSSIDCSSSKNCDKPKQRVNDWDASKAGWTSNHDLWLNLYPHQAKELKFYRPVSGYPSLGMLNPKTSLGFLSLQIRFMSPMSKFKASVISMIHAPKCRWTTAFLFEPQYLETYGLRARHLLTSLPRWIPKFLHIFPSSQVCVRNFYDHIFICFFWLFAIAGTLFLPVYCLPLNFLFCTLFISLSYRFGHHIDPPCRLSLLYEEPCFHPCKNLSFCNETMKNMDRCGELLKKNSSDAKDQLQTDQNSFQNMAQIDSEWKNTKKMIISENFSSIDKTNYNLVHNRLHEDEEREPEKRVHLTATKDGEGIQKIKKHSLHSSEMESLVQSSHYNHNDDDTNDDKDNDDNGDGDAKNTNQPGEITTYTHLHCHNSGGISLASTFSPTVTYPMTRSAKGEMKNEAREGNLLNLTGGTKMNNPQNYPYVYNRQCREFSNHEDLHSDELSMIRASKASIIHSPLGVFLLSLRDATSYSHVDPIFSDDAADQDVQFLLDCILDLFSGVQRITGLISCWGEKLKFAFNWEDPLITSVSYVALSLMCFQLTFLLFLLLKLPRWVARLPLLLPLLIFIMLTDPWIRQKFWSNIFGLDVATLYFAVFSRSPKPSRYAGLDAPKQGDFYLKSDANKAVDHVKDPDECGSLSPSRLKWNYFPESFRYLIQNKRKTFLSVHHGKKVEIKDSITSGMEWLKHFSHQSHIIHSETESIHHSTSLQNRSVSILSVNARLVGSRSKQSIISHYSWAELCVRLMISVFQLLQVFVLSTLALLHRYIFSLIFEAIRFFFVLFMLVMLHVLDVLCRFFLHWWLRLPDRREIEHREIAVSQNIPSSLQNILYCPVQKEGSPKIDNDSFSRKLPKMSLNSTRQHLVDQETSQQDPKHPSHNQGSFFYKVFSKQAQHQDSTNSPVGIRVEDKAENVLTFKETIATTDQAKSFVQEPFVWECSEENLEEHKDQTHNTENGVNLDTGLNGGGKEQDQDDDNASKVEVLEYCPGWAVKASVDHHAAPSKQTTVEEIKQEKIVGKSFRDFLLQNTPRENCVSSLMEISKRPLFLLCTTPEIAADKLVTSLDVCTDSDSLFNTSTKIVQIKKNLPTMTVSADYCVDDVENKQIPSVKGEENLEKRHDEYQETFPPSDLSEEHIASEMSLEQQNSALRENDSFILTSLRSFRSLFTPSKH